MIAANESVLKELCQMRSSATLDWLKDCRQDALERLANVEDPAIRGEIRALKEMIDAIEKARDRLDVLQRGKQSMKKAF